MAFWAYCPWHTPLFAPHSPQGSPFQNAVVCVEYWGGTWIFAPAEQALYHWATSHSSKSQTGEKKDKKAAAHLKLTASLATVWNSQVENIAGYKDLPTDQLREGQSATFPSFGARKDTSPRGKIK